MGLDAVELVMAVEEEFKIVLADAEAAQCTTVGKLVEYVFARLRQTAGGPCPSQHGFYVVRRTLMDLAGAPRVQIKPDTRLDHLIGWTGRRRVWRGLMGSLTGCKAAWPPLACPRWLKLMVAVIIPVVVMGLWMMAFSWSSFDQAFVLAASAGLLGYGLTMPLHRAFPRGFSQVQDLVKLVTTLDTRTWSRDEVFQKIRVITAGQLGVDQSLVTWDAEFVNDLGAG